MSLKVNQVKSFFSFKRILLPVLIGLSVSVYLLSQNLFEETYVKNADGSIYKTSILDLLKKVEWGYGAILCLILSVLSMIIRDLAYMLRLRILSDKQLSWKSCFNSIMLWETASAITPSVVGGSSIAMFILNKEGINLGKSTAIVMASALLDELFFIVFVPLMFLIVGTSSLFPDYISFSLLGQSMDVFKIFLIGYGAILVFVIFVSWGLFFQPRGLKKILFTVFKLSFLKKWQKKAILTGNEIMIASQEFKQKKASYWLKSFGATSLSWTSRYLTANFIIMAFVLVDDHFLIVARQLVMWVILLISPTPGGSGIAEMLFASFLKDSSIQQLAIVAAIVWRFVGYYPYLFIGAIIFPTWLKNVNAKK